GHVDETETAVLKRITGPSFGLSSEEAQTLLDLASTAAEEANDLFKWTKQINEHFEPDHKIQLIELLWRVVLADDIVTDYEANLLRRVAGLIHVSDKDSAMARQNAQAD
ncbi:TerB family tellurite resistance protein, partial [Alphaproteobacteria bacterium]|nr:TerB family tellurite resistance protein [Alphaproteobacteria bacterium]